MPELTDFIPSPKDGQRTIADFLKQVTRLADKSQDGIIGPFKLSETTQEVIRGGAIHHALVLSIANDPKAQLTLTDFKKLSKCLPTKPMTFEYYADGYLAHAADFLVITVQNTGLQKNYRKDT